jgi:two-component system sensor histidine kinase PilS (NtrC family)
MGLYGVSGIIPLDPASFRSKLRLVTVVRILVITMLLAGTVLLQGEDRGAGFFGPEVRQAIYILSILVYAASAIYVLVLLLAQKPRTLITLTWAQLIVDVIFAAGLALQTGGTGSIFSFFFSVAVASAALLLYRRGALIVATLSTVLFAILALVELSPAVRDLLTSTPFLVSQTFAEPTDDRTVLWNLLVNTLAFYAIAYLSSYLAEQLRAADQRLEAQQSTIQSLEGLLDNIISSIPVGVVTLRGDGTISFANPEALRICGKQSEDVLDHRVSRIFPDLRHILSNREKLGRGVNEITSQLVGREIRLLRWTICPLETGGANADHDLLLFEDITDLVTLQRQMQESRQLAAIGELAAGIAHEIRNPLGAISGCVQMLKAYDKDGEQNPQKHRLMNIILREAQHLNNWIGEFLQYARPNNPDFQNLDLERFIHDTVMLAKKDPDFHRTKINIAVESTEAPYVQADPGQVRQVVWNLLQNARQALIDVEDPKINISIEHASSASGKIVLLKIQDNGEGIPETNQKSVFEPFFTTRRHGTGLGLATVHRIMQSHRGSVQLISEEGAGTMFEIAFPVLARSNQ